MRTALSCCYEIDEISYKMALANCATDRTFESCDRLF